MLDDDLKTSVQRYREILEHTQQLESLLAHGEPERLRSYTVKLNSLQEEAGLQDRELLAEFSQNLTRWQTSPLYQERLQLMQQIVAANQLLLPKIHGMMSVTAAELTQVKEGRVAVSGYQQSYARAPRSSRGIG